MDGGFQGYWLYDFGMLLRVYCLITGNFVIYFGLVARRAVKPRFERKLDAGYVFKGR
jgi:hypothetical protein